jgi:hypothetical protein
VSELFHESRQSPIVADVSSSPSSRTALLPPEYSLLPSSQDALRTAEKLRAAGELPASLSLWAVANPLIETDASRLEQKVRPTLAGSRAGTVDVFSCFKYN